MDVNQRIQRLENWLSRIGDTLDRPIWDGQDFAYKEITPKHVAYLKAVRAVSSLHALPLLYGRGLLIDGGTMVRCINEVLSEIHFVLESYPATTRNVEKFVAHFVAASPTTKDKEAQPVASQGHQTVTSTNRKEFTDYWSSVLNSHLPGRLALRIRVAIVPGNAQKPSSPFLDRQRLQSHDLWHFVFDTGPASTADT